MSGNSEIRKKIAPGTLLKGAALLGAAAIISKLLGTLQKIPLQNIAGDEAFGIYSAVYPFYILILFLSSAGFPVAVSTFVAERAAQGRDREAQQILAVSTWLLFISGAFFFLLLFFGAGTIAALIGNSQTADAIRSVSFALLFVPAMSALRGYFQGYQNMLPTAVSQVAEQLVRVAAMITLLLIFHAVQAPQSRIAAGATFGSVAGAAAGLLVMLAYWNKERSAFADHSEKQPLDAEHRNGWRLAKQIALYALPICLGTIVVPALNIIDAFTMPRLLEANGLSELQAMAEFGIYNRGVTLVQLVAMIASSVSVAIVPAIAEAKANHDPAAVQRRSRMSLKMAWMIGLAASCGLAVLALPVNVLLFRNTAGTWSMVIIAFTAVFSTLNITSASVLQGIGAVKAPAVNLLAAAVLKFALNVWLLPLWGIRGGALATVLAFALASSLNLWVLKLRDLKVLTGSDLLKPIWPVLGMSLSSAAIAAALLKLGALVFHSGRLIYAIAALAGVSGGAAVFVLLLFASGAVALRDLQSLPRIHRILSPFLLRFKRISQD